MRLAFTRWGLAPSAFWAMTPRELAAALGGGRPAPGLDRAALDRLMRRFPDASASPEEIHASASPEEIDASASPEEIHASASSEEIDAPASPEEIRDDRVR